jgi:rubrerythrin
MDFTKTKTYKNLQDAFSGESQASMRYAIFAAKAKEEGHKELEEFFLEASQEEKGHATLWYGLFNGGSVPTSKENVEKAIQHENEEWTDSYEVMAKVAREEGFEDIAKHFDQVASEEEGHEGHLHDFLKNL